MQADAVADLKQKDGTAEQNKFTVRADNSSDKDTPSNSDDTPLPMPADKNHVGAGGVAGGMRRRPIAVDKKMPLVRSQKELALDEDTCVGSFMVRLISLHLTQCAKKTTDL